MQETVLFHIATQSHVKATLRPVDVYEVEAIWTPYEAAIIDRANHRGLDTEGYLQHKNLSWVQKYDTAEALSQENLVFEFIGLECDNEVQGLVVLSYAPFIKSKIAPSEQIVFIDYLEAAPWNQNRLLRYLGDAPRYSEVGTRLVAAAVQQSLNCGFGGRIGLESLHQSVSFYEARCGMIIANDQAADIIEVVSDAMGASETEKSDFGFPLGTGDDEPEVFSRLPYMEMTPEQADRLLQQYGADNEKDTK